VQTSDFLCRITFCSVLVQSLTINTVKVEGGIPVSPNKDTWNGNVMMVAADVLKASGNTLHIEARNTSGNGGGDIDDFILDNVVIMYKTR
jgi:hypothetical protein